MDITYCFQRTLCLSLPAAFSSNWGHITGKFCRWRKWKIGVHLCGSLRDPRSAFTKPQGQRPIPDGRTCLSQDIAVLLLYSVFRFHSLKGSAWLISCPSFPSLHFSLGTWHVLISCSLGRWLAGNWVMQPTEALQAPSGEGSFSLPSGLLRVKGVKDSRRPVWAEWALYLCYLDCFYTDALVNRISL